MATAFDSVCGRCRRSGEKLFIKGEKCSSPKCPMVRRAYTPGIHGPAQKGSSAPSSGGRGSTSDYGRQLKEKQALRAAYGLRERQLKKYYLEAIKKKGVTGDFLIQRLESRLDNVVYRLGYGISRQHARQLVGHGMFALNGRSVDIPSLAVKKGDVITIKETKRKKIVFNDLQERLANKSLPNWLERTDTYSGKVVDTPILESHELPADVQAIVEFYSR